MFLLLFFCFTLCYQEVYNDNVITSNPSRPIENKISSTENISVQADLKKIDEKLSQLVKVNDNDNSNSAINAQDVNEPTIDVKKLKRMLKKIKPDHGHSFQKTNTHFRSYDEIKKDLDEMKMHIKTDVEILTELVLEFKELADESKFDEDSSQPLLSILIDLEHLLHQYDNALEFAKLNGFTTVVIPSINISTNSNIRAQALLMLGSAAQSNIRVQKAALESGCVTLLLKFLASDPEPLLINRGLFALSCLIRNYPQAQVNFIKEGGISVLTTVFDEVKFSKEQIRFKIANLLSDLLIESQETSETPLRGEAYEPVKLADHLIDQRWCHRTSEWLCQLINWKNLPGYSEEDLNHEAVGSALDLMLSLIDVCLPDFTTNLELFNVVNHSKIHYDNLVLREMEEGELDSFYSEILKKFRLLAKALARTTVYKDEL